MCSWPLNEWLLSLLRSSKIYKPLSFTLIPHSQVALSHLNIYDTYFWTITPKCFSSTKFWWLLYFTCTCRWWDEKLLFFALYPFHTRQFIINIACTIYGSLTLSLQAHNLSSPQIFSTIDSAILRTAFCGLYLNLLFCSNYIDIGHKPYRPQEKSISATGQYRPQTFSRA